ncbi:MAG: glutathione S-transferase family protein [Solirubrobacteraceae bacterium]
MASAPRTTLWHITISHYSEKARWALDYKSIPHRLRALVPGAHIPVALWLTRGRHYTVPVLDLGSQRIGDSTAIIAALEQRHPEPPLYPRAPAQRRRALALEEWFDEELGPYIRRFVFHELGRDRERFAELGAKAAPQAFRLMGPAGATCASTLTGLRYRARSDDASEAARMKVIAAIDRLEAELGANDYLVGDGFSVADLTAAALLYPLVLPSEAYVTIERMPAPVEQLRARLRKRRGYRWVQEMFRRHRHPAEAPNGSETEASA